MYENPGVTTAPLPPAADAHDYFAITENMSAKNAEFVIHFNFFLKESKETIFCLLNCVFIETPKKLDAFPPSHVIIMKSF